MLSFDCWWSSHFSCSTIPIGVQNQSETINPIRTFEYLTPNTTKFLERENSKFRKVVLDENQLLQVNHIFRSSYKKMIQWLCNAARTQHHIVPISHSIEFSLHPRTIPYRTHIRTFRLKGDSVFPSIALFTICMCVCCDVNDYNTVAKCWTFAKFTLYSNWL